MNETVQLLITILLVAAAGWYVLGRIWRLLRGTSGGCGACGKCSAQDVVPLESLIRHAPSPDGRPRRS